MKQTTKTTNNLHEGAKTELIITLLVLGTGLAGLAGLFSLNTILYSCHPNMLLAYKTIITASIIYETI